MNKNAQVGFIFFLVCLMISVWAVLYANTEAHKKAERWDMLNKKLKAFDEMQSYTLTTDEYETRSQELKDEIISSIDIPHYETNAYCVTQGSGSNLSLLCRGDPTRIK